MEQWLLSLEPHWLWLSLGVLLVALEILVPGFFLIWLGLAAAATGIITWILSPAIPVQLGLFALLALATLYAARHWLKRNPIESTDPLLNQRGHRLIGEMLTLTSAITDGKGRARVGDGEWNVRGPDAAIGSKVRVIGIDGSSLIVEPAFVDSASFDRV